MRVVYSPGYRIGFFGIERLHPFDIGKYDRIARHLVDEGLVERDGFGVPPEVTETDLAAVHDPDYLRSLHRASELSRALEVPLPRVFPGFLLNQRVLAPMRRAVGGTLAATRQALEHGAAVNLGGGFHHARPALGHGFCLYNDVAYAVHVARSEGMTGRILILDTDVHQGDGNHAFFADDPSVTTLSLQQRGLFPIPRVPGDLDVELPAGTGDDAYLDQLDSVLARLDELVRAAAGEPPGLVFHVAGADVLHDDPLAGLALTVDGLVERDARVFRAVRSRGIGLVHLLAGGYGPSAATSQARSIANLLEIAA